MAEIEALVDIEDTQTHTHTHSHYCDRTLASHPHLFSLVLNYTSGETDTLVNFILDPSTLPDVILARQLLGQDVHNILFYLTRTFCHSLHKAKMKLLGLI